jgi:hypothetical protein
MELIWIQPNGSALDCDGDAVERRSGVIVLHFGERGAARVSRLDANPCAGDPLIRAAEHFRSDDQVGQMSHLKNGSVKSTAVANALGVNDGPVPAFDASGSDARPDEGNDGERYATAATCAP